MKIVMFVVLFILFNIPVSAEIRSDFDSILKERKECNLVYENFAKSYKAEYEKAIEGLGGCNIVYVYEYVREVQQYWQECWTYFSMGTLALFEGEVKFAVVPGVIERLSVVQAKLIDKYNSMKVYAEKIDDAKCRLVLLQFIKDSEREFEVMKRYNTVLTSY